MKEDYLWILKEMSAAGLRSAHPVADLPRPRSAPRRSPRWGSCSRLPSCSPMPRRQKRKTSPASTPPPGPLPPLTTDYDADNDGLIDIRTLAQLNAVRHDLDGDGKQGSVSATDWATYTAAFSNPASGMGCKPTDHDDDTTTAQQPTCDGYELMADLDFDTNGDGEVNSSDTDSYANWTPIGTAANPFNAKFKGNSHSNTALGSMASFGVRNAKISNLTISGELTEVGLFGATSATARIEGVGLVDVNVNTTTSARNAKISALVGNNAGRITACSVTGKISAGAGAYPDAGGLVGYNGGTIAAAFSRATVYMTSSSEIYVGGLVGYNGGTITATYSAGAVKGKGGSGVVGGLVGYNVGTITASYSIAPVTAATGIINAGGGLVGYNDRTKGGAITASYWDYISSGIDDDADDAMPEGKSTSDLMSTTSASGIYADWDDLTIGDANDVDPWVFNDFRFLPLLTYGGHTTDQSGNQLFASITPMMSVHLGEGMKLKAGTKPYGGAHSGRDLPWQWQSSTDGITWGSTLVSNTVCSVHQDRTCGPAYRATSSAYLFITRPEHEGKYIRARAPLTTGGYAYSRVIGKVKLASPATNPIPPMFILGGHNPPRVGTKLSVNSGAVSLWQRCDINGANPSGCEYVGSWYSYTPGAGDLNHYLRAYVYDFDDTYSDWTRTTVDFAQKVADIQRSNQWE